MIAKRIERKAEERDDFSHLGRYVAAAKEKGEKLDKFWIVNCDAGAGLDDLDTALIEIEATRAMKPDVSDKTYHLVVSFHTGEEAKLSLEDLQDIERNFAEALGFADHQRICGTHINTDNFHLHIAFNKVHPETLRVHTPHRDFFSLSKVCRAMEQKYGLQVDKGMDSPNPVSAKARDFEAKTWQQSFESHLLEHKSEILAVIAGAASWKELHEGLAEFDTVLRKRGAGLVLAQIGGKGAMKASALDRSCSLAALEKRLGPFVAAPERSPPEKEQSLQRPPKQPYEAKPLTRHPATDRLWRNYRRRKPPGFLARNFHIRNWKDYLLADAHKDALALAILITYKEFFRALEGTPARRPYRAPRTVNRALESWFAASPWKPPAISGMTGDDIRKMALKADTSGRVLFPLRDADGHVWAVRALDGAGRSCDIGDATARPGLTHVIDPDGHLATGGTPYAGRIVLTADCLAAAAMHKETGEPVVIAAGPQHLPALARSLRARHPNAAIVVVGMVNSQAATRAAEIAGGSHVVLDGRQVLMKWVADQAGKGNAVPVDPVLAREMGAFVENALSPAEAINSQPGKVSAQQKSKRNQNMSVEKSPEIER